MKKKLYETYKVQEYWIADTDKKTIEIFSYTGRTYKTIGVYKEENIVESDLIKRLKFNIREIF